MNGAILLGVLLFAQLPDANPAALGPWLVNGASMMVILLLGKQLFWRDKKYVDQSVTKGELALSLTSYVSKVDLTEYVKHADLRDMQNSTNSRMHEMTAQINALQLRVEVLNHSLTKEVEPALGRLMNQMEQSRILLTRIALRLEVLEEDGGGVPPGAHS